LVYNPKSYNLQLAAHATGELDPRRPLRQYDANYLIAKTSVLPHDDGDVASIAGYLYSSC
jgi:hypothetical protein